MPTLFLLPLLTIALTQASAAPRATGAEANRPSKDALSLQRANALFYEVPQDRSAAGKLYASLCVEGSADVVSLEACAQLAAFVGAGWAGFSEDAGRATALARATFAFAAAACEAGNWNLCVAEGRFHVNGWGVPEDGSKALERFGRACAHRQAAGCAQVGAFMLDAGDVSGGMRRLEEACTLGAPQACGLFAELLEEGKLVPKDEARARELYVRACQDGDAAACVPSGFRLSSAGVSPEEGRKGVQLLERGCALGEARACVVLASAVEEGRFVEKDAQRAASLNMLSCEGHNKFGCWNAAVAHRDGEGVAQDVARYLELAKQACGLESGVACAELGRLHEAGRFVAVDLPVAFGFYKRACALEDPGACQRGAMMLVEGRGVEESLGSARDMFARACALDAAFCP
jgi:TPR repeat protein